MIRYTLKCAEGHTFESWFQSADAFDKLANHGLLSCSVCGETEVSKAMMSPKVAAEKAQEAPLSTPSEPHEEALRKMREHVEKTSTYVGGNFAQEARAQHLGDTPEKAIYGEAAPEEARALIEDGVPILPLPGPPKRKSN